MTDGRFSGGTYGLVVGHIAPEAQLVDLLPTSVQVIWLQLTKITKEITMHVSDKSWRNVKLKLSCHHFYSRGVLGKYAHIVSSASRGAVTDFWNMDKSGKA